jgi:probable phosphoglycerate mutase
MRVAYVHIVRHGETDANVRGVIQGHLDTDLNEVRIANRLSDGGRRAQLLNAHTMAQRGYEQAALVGLALKDVPFQKAWSSDLTRTVKVPGTERRQRGMLNVR